MEDGPHSQLYRPQKLEIPERQHVLLMIEATETTTSEDMLALAAQVYEGLSPKDAHTVEEIASNRRDFFGDYITVVRIRKFSVLNNWL